MTTDRTRVVHVSPLGWTALALVILLPWAVVVWLASRTPPLAYPAAVARTSAKPASGAATPKAAAAAPTRAAGPWGRLSTSRILIEPPEDFIPPYFTTPQPLRWTFRGFTVERLAALWRDAELSAEQRQALEAATARTIVDGALIITPTAELVISLTPAARAKIYSVLAQFPENIVQRDPFRSRADAVGDWFDDFEIAPELVQLTRKLLYPRDGNQLFSDHDVILPRLASAAERVRFIKTLSRKSALLVQLQVEHGTNVDALARYWGSGRRSKDVRPLLESMANLPGGGTIDVVHLLPAFARLLLYTYPLPTDGPTAGAQDCHWTSLNFFNSQPDNRFLSLDFVQQTLLQSYYQVGDEPVLGDIIMLVQDGGQGVHSCVYIADNIVFTKNGAAFSVPWTLAPLDQVVSFYSIAGPLEIRRYRAK